MSTYSIPTRSAQRTSPCSLRRCRTGGNTETSGPSTARSKESSRRNRSWSFRWRMPARAQRNCRAQTSTAWSVPPTGVRKGNEVVQLHRAGDKADCFEALSRIPSYTIPRVRPLKPVPRLAKLASLLAETSLEDTPVKEYRQTLVAELLAERK